MKNRKQKDGMDAVTDRVPAANAGADVVAQFGEAVLARIEGRIVLRGGSMTDRMEALEWLSMFMPDAVASIGE